MLRRIGNKTRMATQIQAYFPEHTVYVEPFFGAGGMFFNKPLAKYNILNDDDNDVFNLFTLLLKDKDALKDAIALMPIHKTLLQYYKKNKGTTDIEKAIRFLFLSNYTLYGKGDTIKFGTENHKKILLSKIDATFEKLQFVQFECCDFKRLFKVVPKRQIKETFAYLDPPYLGTTSNYEHQWTEQDAEDMFECAVNSGVRFAISEFDNPIILALAKKYDLNIIIIGERQNLKNVRTEILITNYQK